MVKLIDLNDTQLNKRGFDLNVKYGTNENKQSKTQYFQFGIIFERKTIAQAKNISTNRTEQKRHLQNVSYD